MTEERVAPLTWIGQKIEANLWAIIAAGLAAYGGHVTGMSRVGELEKDVAKLEHKLDAVIPRIERIDASLAIQAELAKEQRQKEGK